MSQKRQSPIPPSSFLFPTTLTFAAPYLPYRPLEPPPRTQNPQSETITHHNPHRHHRIIYRLRVHGVFLRKHEHDRNETYPQNRENSDRAGEVEVEGGKREGERSRSEVCGEEKAKGDGDTVGDVKSDGGDAGCGREGNATPEGG